MTGVIIIGLQDRDKHILEKLTSLLCPDKPLLFVKRREETHQDSYVFSFNSIHMSKQLTKLGCVPAKSLILQFPQWLKDTELQRHFIRGYFDGDGSLSVGNNKDYQYKFKITSTLDMDQNIEKIIKSQIDINFYYDQHINGITMNLCSGGNRQVLKIMGWLYKDATIFLKRKNDLYLDLKEWCQNVDARYMAPNRHINQYV